MDLVKNKFIGAQFQKFLLCTILVRTLYCNGRPTLHLSLIHHCTLQRAAFNLRILFGPNYSLARGLCQRPLGLDSSILLHEASAPYCGLDTSILLHDASAPYFRFGIKYSLARGLCTILQVWTHVYSCTRPLHHTLGLDSSILLHEASAPYILQVCTQVFSCTRPLHHTGYFRIGLEYSLALGLRTMLQVWTQVFSCKRPLHHTLGLDFRAEM